MHDETSVILCGPESAWPSGEGPRDSEIGVALCRLPSEGADGNAQRGLSLLPEAMRAEILRTRRPEDRLARIAARLLLRRALASQGLDPNLSGWRRSASGRPCLEGFAADISLAHSEGWAAAAAGRGLRLGLDIEVWRPLDAADVRAYLTPAEIDRAARSSDGRELLRGWCLREAVLKADGAGLLAGEDAIRAIGEGRHPGGRRWWTRVEDLEPGCLALAADPAPRRVALQWIGFESLLDAEREPS